jgi:DNA-binding transcriptional MerR regulator
MPTKNAAPVSDLTLPELAAVVVELVASAAPVIANRRVRAVPDVRTIRWYQTLGVVDRPASYRGRTALFGRRHVLQVAAIKALQAKGMSLAEVQQGLAGRTDAELARAVGHPLAAVDDLMQRTVATRSRAAKVRIDRCLAVDGGSVSPGRAAAFWKPSTTARGTTADVPAAAAISAPALQTVPVGDAVVLLWHGQPLSATNRARLEQLARPVVAFLSSFAAQPVAEQAPRAASPAPRPEEGARP